MDSTDTQNVELPAGARSLDQVVGCGQRHVLKTWPKYFREVMTGAKTFEARKDDRGFKVGDELILAEYHPSCDELSGRKVVRRVTYILRGPDFGVEAGWCVMALAAPNGGDEPRPPERNL